jgi:CBS domain containing-hemolysin-like protein/mannitol/fructose-specific phosphotransferase system IIA component (Ntr-type)
MMIEPMTIGRCLLALLLVFLNGFFVLVEFALVRARETQLELLKRRKTLSADLALGMHRRMDRYLSASQLGITMASLALGWVGEPAFAALLQPLFARLHGMPPAACHTLAFALAFGLITSFHIVLGEQVPKYIAIARAEPSLLATARPMQFSYWVLYLPLLALNAVSNWIVRRLGLPAVTESETAFSKEELRLVLGQSHAQGRMSLTKVLLCENVLDLGDFTARTIMVPLDRVVQLDVRKPWEENRQVILANRYSRYPLCDGDPARIIGFVHFKELMLGQCRGDGPVDLLRYRRELPKIDADAPLESLLPMVQRMPTNMVLVTAKDGTPAGILTFEDLLEELVGEMTDEFERERIWRLRDFLSREAVVVPLQARDMHGAIAELVGRLTPGLGGCDSRVVLERVLQREKQMSTGVGQGLALPHARVERLAHTLIAYGYAPEPIACESIDGQPVRHVFLVLTPLEKPREQLRSLARLSMLFGSDVVSKGLAEAQDAAAVYELLQAADAFTPMAAR